MDLTWESIQETLTSNNVPELLLAVGGVLALLIVLTYLKGKDGLIYKMFVLFGLIVGVVLIILSIDTYGQWALSTSVIVIVAGFALVIRPFREVHFSALLGLLVVAMVYLLLGDLAGGDLDVLSEGWPRIIVAIVAGVLTFTLTNFIESVMKMFGKLLNAWPVLFILGLICVAEAISVYMGYGSIYDLIMDKLDSTQEMIGFYLK